MADLYLMCGVPGSGKSTFLKNHVKNENSIIVSRDEIRFSLLKPHEEYFSHEDEVLKIFWSKINACLAAGYDVFVDQTSLNPKSRKWLKDHVKGYETINIIWIDETLDTCLARNELRHGTQAYVPRSVVRRMYNQFIAPTKEEGFNKIYRFISTGEKNEH